MKPLFFLMAGTLSLKDKLGLVALLSLASLSAFAADETERQFGIVEVNYSKTYVEELKTDVEDLSISIHHEAAELLFKKMKGKISYEDQYVVQKDIPGLSCAYNKRKLNYYCAVSAN